MDQIPIGGLIKNYGSTVSGDKEPSHHDGHDGHEGKNVLGVTFLRFCVLRVRLGKKIQLKTVEP
jgi:hypothetical protein